MDLSSSNATAPDTPAGPAPTIKPHLGLLNTPIKNASGLSNPLLGDDAEEPSPAALPRPASFPPRTLRHPFIAPEPPRCASLSFAAAAPSCAVPTKLWRAETADVPLDDHVLPIDDTIDPNTYVGDWEEMFIRTYHRVFSCHEHQLYWAKSDLGPFVTAATRPVQGAGYPTLSLGPNGYHFAYLPAVADVDLPAPKHLTKLFPHLEECKFTYAREGDKLAQELLSFEQKMKPTRYKFGVLYVAPGQTEENDFYGNLDPSEGCLDFCRRLGRIIELRGHKDYRGGLDCTGDTTGELSLYTTVRLADGRFIGRDGKMPPDAHEMVDLELMFHVAPFLPHEMEENAQQLHKKRHLGNDIVIIIYKDGDTKMNPDVFKSQFNHVFIVVTPCAATAGAPPTHYKVEVLTKNLKRFMPELPADSLIPVERIADWVLLKCINGEMTAMRSKDFRGKMKRTRVKTLEGWAAFSEKK